jgi:hypothetical protein
MRRLHHHDGDAPRGRRLRRRVGDADPEAVLWGEAAWLADATAKLKDIADQHFHRGEYAA